MRVTDRQLKAMAETVNRQRGHETPVPWGTVGAVYVYGAYGATAVHEWVNESGGAPDLSGLATKREIYYFLRGMIAGRNNE